MANAIFEIFSEELPATLQKKIMIDYKQFAEQQLKTLNTNIKPENISIGITLNRLVLKLENIDINQEQLLKFIDITLSDFSKTFPRTMCYPQLTIRWLRPIRGLFACIDNNVLTGKFYGLELTDHTYIDKFNKRKCNSFKDYLAILEQEKVEIDYNKRLQFVQNEVNKITQNNQQEYKNIKLLEEIAGMSEYCIEPILSILEQKFNILPFELIELVLRENQRYVVFKPNKNNQIQFLIFGDKITANQEKRQQVKEGHNKVVNARLEDALYYWQLDQQEKEKSGNTILYKENLKKILSHKIFVDDISWEDYANEQIKLAEKIIENKTILETTKQLIWDTKLDLSTGVVAEFPELQGVIGGYYFGYNFNPYHFDSIQAKNYTEEILYYYLIDRIVYVATMYQQGKQPTGSGDKYKVKARMDDVVLIFNQMHFSLSILKTNHDIYNLFLKRFQKIIEDNNKNIENIKQIANICCQLIDKDVHFNLPSILTSVQNTLFIKTYKRINGYTQNITFIENDEIKKKAFEIMKNEDDFNTCNDYLNSHKIEGDTLIKQALMYVRRQYFENKLPLQFLI